MLNFEVPQVSQLPEDEFPLQNPEEQGHNKAHFIESFITSNQNITQAGKEYLLQTIQQENGPWTASEGFVQEVTQDGDTITVHTKTGESLYYLPE